MSGWCATLRAYLRGDGDSLARQPLSGTWLLIGPGVIGLGRHALEIVGGNPGSCRWSVASVTDTVLFAYFIAYVLFAAILFWHHADAAQVALALRVSLPFTTVIHGLAPIGNALLNYHGPRWPEAFFWPWLPTHLYFPAGTMLGFGYAIVAGSSWIRKILGLSTSASVVAGSLVAGGVFLYCYQLAVAFAFGPGLRLFYPALLRPGLAGIEQRTHFYNAWLA